MRCALAKRLWNRVLIRCNKTPPSREPRRDLLSTSPNGMSFGRGGEERGVLGNINI